MFSGPPKLLEGVVGFLLPPACREEILGDLSERYSSPGRYVVLALRTVPFVIGSRIRRTTDALVLLTEALLVYGSYLVAAWYTDRALLASQWGLLRLAIPTILNLVVLVLEHAWDFKPGWPMRLTEGCVIGTCIYFNVYGGSAALLLVAGVEILFRPVRDLPQAATGPAVWTEPAAISRTTINVLATAGAITLIAIFLLALRPWSAGAVVIVIVVIWLQLGKSRKE